MGKPNTSEKLLPRAALFNTHPGLTDPVANPGLRVLISTYLEAVLKRVAISHKSNIISESYVPE
jgi:hypothetical protein